MTGDGPYFVTASAKGLDGRAVGADGAPPFAGQLFYNPSAGNIGALQRRMLTGPSVFGMDAALTKEVRITERHRLEFRMEALNVFNHPTFAIFSQDINSPRFGKITSTALAPRQMQFGLKYRF